MSILCVCVCVRPSCVYISGDSNPVSQHSPVCTSFSWARNRCTHGRAQVTLYLFCFGLLCFVLLCFAVLCFARLDVLTDVLASLSLALFCLTCGRAYVIFLRIALLHAHTDVIAALCFALLYFARRTCGGVYVAFFAWPS